MKQAEGLNYLFLDLNSYFASVEQQDNPRLRGKPVAVVPMETDSTCAIAASYEAKAYGIKTGTKIYHAKRLCPDLILAPARHDVYTHYHHRIMKEVRHHLPIEKICSIDEASCRLIGTEREPDQALSLARRIKAGISSHVGAYLKCSIGLASNRFLAKLATDLQKPDGLVVLRNEDLPGRIAHLSLTDLPGINVRTELRLLRCGIRTIEDLWNMDPTYARKVWGGVQGERFWYALHGYEIPDPVTQKRVIGHSRMLAPDMRSLPKAHLISRALLLKATKRLRRYDLSASSLSFSTRPIDQPRFEAAVTFPATQDSFIFLDKLDALWQSFRTLYSASTRVKKVSLTLSGFKEAQEKQLDFFSDLTPQQNKIAKSRQKLWSCIDQLNQHFGVNTVHLASQFFIQEKYLGTKIAFNRIPDLQEFIE